MPSKTVNKITGSRSDELTLHFYEVLDRHMEEVVEGKALKLFEVQDMAEKLYVHPIHLSNTIKETTGKSPCDIYEEKLIEIAKDLLQNPDKAIADVAIQLTYDPSNFTKFFKKMEGITPKQYRQKIKLK
ncbi:MAG: helix-turn-helix transcriptional regulator [Bacteroidia bacterium]|nr:helix-turn-helix transcriptional regulator [Bacteroidia bacterium]